MYFTLTHYFRRLSSKTPFFKLWRARPLVPQQRRGSGHAGMSELGHKRKSRYGLAAVEPKRGNAFRIESWSRSR